jgi:hypothetical protein
VHGQFERHVFAAPVLSQVATGASMTSRKPAFAALAGLAALIIPATPVRVQAAEEQASPMPCPKARTYTLEVDGTPDKRACPVSIDQAAAVPFNIPPGKLFDALKAFLEQSGSRGHIPLDIMMANVCTAGTSKCTRGAIPTAGVTGTMLPREALQRLLEGTPVSYVQDQSGSLHFPAANDVAVAGGRCVWDKSPWKGCLQ